MKYRKKFISCLLILLVLTTNLVVSVDAVYCFCFKTTSFHISGFEPNCCNDNHVKSINEIFCCKESIDKPSCKTKTQILLSNQENLYSSNKFEPAKKLSCDYIIPSVADAKLFVELNHWTRNIYSKYLQPNSKDSQAILQVFLC